MTATASKQHRPEANGEADPLHLLIDYPPKAQLSTLIGEIKKNTPREIRARNYPDMKRTPWGNHFWSHSYVAPSSGGAIIETIREYTRNQRQLNRKVSRPKTS